ncbi:MAG: hypothetical protein KKE24_04475 [Candidatus Thermoplasmatota archaeon]|nr:hypothetical protein [Candidatus Thermoplasmatota archaeon]
MTEMGDDMKPQEIKELLQVVGTEIPKLVESIMKTMYNAENAESMAKGVAQFYKSMKDAGMDEKQAYDLTQQFMASFSLGGIISKAVAGRGSRDDCD